MSLRAITLWQPWASLVAWGVKRIETRSWATRHRGELLIHASRKFDGDVRADCRRVEAELKALGVSLPKPLHPGVRLWSTGGAVALARLERCERSRGESGYPEVERAVGDLREGRYAWHLADVRPIRLWVPCSGMQGLWAVPPELERRIRDALSESAPVAERPLFPGVAQEGLPR